MYVIEDELHAEQQDGEFESFDAAISELKRRVQIPWDQPPNLAPCTNWQSCGRSYAVIEYDTSSIPWKVIQRVTVLEVSSQGVVWLHSDSQLDGTN